MRVTGGLLPNPTMTASSMDFLGTRSDLPTLVVRPTAEQDTTGAPEDALRSHQQHPECATLKPIDVEKHKQAAKSHRGFGHTLIGGVSMSSRSEACHRGNPLWTRSAMMVSFSRVPGMASEAANLSNSTSRGSKSQIPILIASSTDLGTAALLPSGNRRHVIVSGSVSLFCENCQANRSDFARASLS